MDTRSLLQTTMDRRHLIEGAALSAAATALPADAQASENRVQPLLDEWLRLHKGWLPGGIPEGEAAALGDAQDGAFNQAMAIEPATVDEIRAQLELAALDGDLNGPDDHLVEIIDRAATFLREVAP